MPDFHGGFHLLDQDEVWRDDDGFSWPINRIPAETARQILAHLRDASFLFLVQYTRYMRARADVARRMGEDVPTDWQPDSAAAYDRLFEAELTHEPNLVALREAVSVEWLNAKPLVRAMDERARSDQ